jgi:outer membrane protein TolC
VARDAIETTATRRKSSELSFNIIEKKYGEGMAPQIEYIDARNTLTQAEIEAALAKYDYAIKIAEYEAAGAVLDLKEFKLDETGE